MFLCYFLTEFMDTHNISKKQKVSLVAVHLKSNIKTLQEIKYITKNTGRDRSAGKMTDTNISI